MSNDINNTSVETEVVSDTPVVETPVNQTAAAATNAFPLSVERPSGARHRVVGKVRALPVHQNKYRGGKNARKGAVLEVFQLNGAPVERPIEVYIEEGQFYGLDLRDKQGRLDALTIGDEVAATVVSVSPLEKVASNGRTHDVRVSEQLFIDELITTAAGVQEGSSVTGTVLAQVKKSDVVTSILLVLPVTLPDGVEVLTRGLLPVGQLDLSGYQGSRDERRAQALAELIEGVEVTAEVGKEPTLNLEAGRPDILLSQTVGVVRSVKERFPIGQRFKGKVLRTIDDERQGGRGFQIGCGDGVLGFLSEDNLGPSAASSIQVGGYVESSVESHEVRGDRVFLTLTRRGFAKAKAKTVRTHALPPGKSGGKKDKKK